VAAILGWLTVGQALTPLGIAGVALVTAGVALTAVAGGRRRPSGARRLRRERVAAEERHGPRPIHGTGDER